MRRKIFNLIQVSPHNRASHAVDLFILFLIILSVVEIILESFRDFESEYHILFVDFEIFSITIFTIEYLLRLLTADYKYPEDGWLKSRLRFIFSTSGIIDLLAILPAFLPLLIKVDLRFLRILRLFRLARIFKLSRYAKSLRLIGQIVREKMPELGISMSVIFLILLIMSILIYHLEGDVQPEHFPNIIAALWWSVVTLTTVGYGDIFPVTDMGKLLAGSISLLSIGLLALPAGIISSGFIERIHRTKKCPHCGKDLEQH